MTEHYLDRLARTINENWDQPALTDFYLTEDSTAQDTSRGNHYTYGKMYAEILRLGELFNTLGMQKGDHIAICGTNSAHWAIAYLAIAAYQGVAVTILHSQSPEDIAHQIDFSDAKALFADVDLWEELKDRNLPQVEYVISLENWKILKGKQIQIINHKFETINRDCHFSIGDIDNLAMICFTSGSTGVSKGVMLSYRNLSATINCVCATYTVKKNKGMLVLLPLAHILATLGEFLSNICQGCDIKIFAGEKINLSILSALEIIKPFEIVTPPMLISKFVEHSRTLMSSSLDYCVVGGAILSKDLATRLVKEHNLPLTVGYGVTETSALIGQIKPQKYRIGSCGVVCPTLSLKLSPTGEILVKGENVMLGYYKDPEATARKIDKDGWLHTGDKGHLDEDGYLYVEGRLEQDMIVLPNGENIHPEDIERKINALPEVKESVVLARDGKLVAIVVPQITNHQLPITHADLRRSILRQINPQLPLFGQLYDIEITDIPLQRTEKQTLKRYLYK